MGMYVNPTNGPKEGWLNAHAEHVLTKAPKWDDVSFNKGIVCLVNNGPFTAAGICYSRDELECFADPKDMRPKVWFIVPKDALIAVCPQYANYA